MKRMVFALGFLACVSTAEAQQSDNHVLHAVPTPGKVVIDGNLDDWDLSGQIEVYAHYRMKNSYSTKVAAMYDDQFFYLGIVWRDPTPMFNMVDSRFDIGSGWRSDCVQLRVRTDMTMHVDCWYSTAAKHPVINIAYGRFTHGRNAEDVKHFQSLTDAIKVGAKEAFKMGADGKSYTQEIALPWKLITGQAAIRKDTGEPYKPPKSYKAGDTFNMGMEFLWGGPDGKTWPVHRYADLLQEGHTSREFFWTAEKAWGTVKLEPEGNLDLPEPEVVGIDAFLQKTQGPVALKYTMPFDGFVTLVIEDEHGIRVKNLVGMAPRSKGEQVDYWDGTDENGRLVAPGRYRWRGLLHQGIDPVYVASYGTPGDPPWDNASNTGAWMSDHNPPLAVAAGKDMMVLAAGGSEAGWAMIGTDLNGRKKWGLRKFQNVSSVAVDDRYVYAGIGGTWGDFKPAVGRADLKTGKYAPFDTKPEPTLIADVLKDGEEGVLRGIAVHGERLAVSLSGIDVVRFLDKRTAAPVGRDVAVESPGGLTCDAAGNLYVISGKQVLKVANGAASAFITGNLEEPVDVAVGRDGTVFVSDRGTHQVKVFNAKGAFVRAIGTPGGRPKPGKWMPNGMRNPAGLDVDPKGRIWVAEEDLQPKRVSVWSADGKLITDYIGPTTYGGMGAFVDSRDKTRVFGVACEWKLDYKNNKAQVVANCLPGLFAGELLHHDGREYFMAKRGRLFIRKGAAFVPAVRFGRAGDRGMTAPCSRTRSQKRPPSPAPPATGAATGSTATSTST